jgi:hypothetical protein
LGAAVASPDKWKLAGYWIDGERDTEIGEIGLKRYTTPNDKLRAKRLALSSPAINQNYDERGDIKISKMYDPEWLDEDERDERLDQWDQSIIDEASGAND